MKQITRFGYLVEYWRAKKGMSSLLADAFSPANGFHKFRPILEVTEECAVFRIPNPYFWELNDNFWGRKFYSSLWIGPNFFLHKLKINIIYKFVIFVATKKRKVNNFFSPLSFVAILGSGSVNPLLPTPPYPTHQTPPNSTPLHPTAPQSALPHPRKCRLIYLFSAGKEVPFSVR